MGGVGAGATGNAAVAVRGATGATSRLAATEPAFNCNRCPTYIR